MAGSLSNTILSIAVNTICSIRIEFSVPNEPPLLPKIAVLKIVFWSAYFSSHTQNSISNEPSSRVRT